MPRNSTWTFSVNSKHGRLLWKTKNLSNQNGLWGNFVWQTLSTKYKKSVKLDSPDLCHAELNGLWGIFVEQTFSHKYGKKVQQNSHYHWTGIQLYVYSLLLYEVYHLFHKIHKSKLWRLFVSAHCNIRLIFSTEFPTQYLFCGRLSNDWLNLPGVQRTLE